ncbi:MAG: O-antigen ligase family protein [Anaerolineales bacterium]|nr:O-antigen ligase family protein [Anaerolineales bacterium]
MNQFNWSTLNPRIVRVAWGLLFVTLPITSFPYFPSGIGGKTLVRPLAVYPLIVLALLLTIPRLFKKPLPRTLLPLLAFVVVALISSVAAFSSDLEEFRGVTMASRFIRNMVTLGLGVTFYLTVALLPETWDDLAFSLRWLYAGFALALLWGSLQIPYVIHYSPVYFEWADRVQSLISTRKLFTTRISGMTYEPKWFAEQICFLLLPWLLGAILTRRSLFRWRYKWVTIEWLLLGWSTVILIFTYSRTGLFTLVILAVLGYFLFRLYTQEKLAKKPPKSKWRLALEIISLTVGMIGALVLVGSQNTYFSRLWRYWTEAETRNKTYLEFIAFQQRFAYWITAYRTFETSPLLGVGLGNYAFYFDEMLPNQSWHLQPEIIRQITPAEDRDRLITPKNLYARLLAETGLLGTVVFTTFVLAIIGCLLFLWFSQSPDEQYWGMSGSLAMVVFAIVIFSFDSFALPNMWIVFGLITAAAHIADPAAG